MAATPPSPHARALRVAVVADHALVAEAVRAALVDNGYDVAVVRWPVRNALDEGDPIQRRRRRRRSPGPGPDVALLLSGLGRIEEVRAAQAMVEGLNVPWLVLTTAPRGPAWGALYERGASLVTSTDVRLGETCDLLENVAHDRQEQAGGRRRRDLIRDWQQFHRQRADLVARLGTLTERETEVLELLHEGTTVREIAEAADVNESTVRSQVKAVLRKLNLSSQIAAVAAYEAVQTDSIQPVGTSS